MGTEPTALSEPRIAAAARFVIAAIAAAIGAAVVYLGLVRTATGQELENMALRGARQEFLELRQESLVSLHEISALGFAVAIALVMAVALRRGKRRLAIAAALVMAVSAFIAEVAKALLPRPELVTAPAGWLNNSFPSGHVTVAVAIGIGAVIVAPYAFRWLVTIVAAGYAAGIGTAVATAGWHRLSGVVGATLLVIAVASVALYLLARSGRVRPFGRRRLAGAVAATIVLGIPAIALAIVGLVLGYGPLLPVPQDPTTEELAVAYTATLVAANAVVLAAFTLFLWLIRPYAIDEQLTP